MAGQEPGRPRRKGEVSDIREASSEGAASQAEAPRGDLLGPVALVVLLLAWSSANEGGAVQRREARGVTARIAVHNASGSDAACTGREGGRAAGRRGFRAVRAAQTSGSRANKNPTTKPRTKPPSRPARHGG